MEKEPKEPKEATLPKTESYLSLVKSLYRDKGMRPLSKAMAEASRLWGELKVKKPKL